MKLFGFVIVSERKLTRACKTEYLRGKSAAFVEATEEIRLRHGADSTLPALSLLKEWADFDLAKHAGIEHDPPSRGLYRRPMARHAVAKPAASDPAAERTKSDSQALNSIEQPHQSKIPTQPQGEGS